MNENFLQTALTPELICTDIKISRGFYVNALGFSIQYERPEDGFAMMERQGSRIMLDQIVPSSERTWIAAPLQRPFGRGMNLQIQTTDVDGLYAKAKEAAAVIFMPMEEKWYRADNCELGNRQFIVQDPDGYLLRFFENLGKRPFADHPLTPPCP